MWVPSICQSPYGACPSTEELPTASFGVKVIAVLTTVLDHSIVHRVALSFSLDSKHEIYIRDTKSGKINSCSRKWAWLFAAIVSTFLQDTRFGARLPQHSFLMELNT